MRDSWKFSKTQFIEAPMFDSALEDFYKDGVSGLVRENIQNSLDAKLQENKDPVEIIINIGSMKKTEVPGISEIKERINCLEGHNDYTKEAIKNMKKALKKNTIDYISFEDRNTKGLTGAENGQRPEEGDTWGIYAYKRGVHFYEKNSSVEDVRGGSYGVGKLACNAASDLNIMFFSNCDENLNKHIGGTIQLIEHEYDNKNFRATGYFTDMDYERNIYVPFENRFEGIFKKDMRGLKVIVPFLRKSYNDEREIIRSICDNFFVAILKEEIVIYINDIKIDKLSLNKIINDHNYYDHNIENYKDNFTPLYYKTYTEYKPEKITIEDLNRNRYDFNLYLQINEKIKRGQMAVVRNIGMKIEDRTIWGQTNRPFNAILVPFSKKEDSFLKTLEDKSHKKIESNHIKNHYEKKNADEFIKNIGRVVGKRISEILEEMNPTDGKIDTSDLIYTTPIDKQIEEVLKGSKDNNKELEIKSDDGKPNFKLKDTTPNIKANKDKGYGGEEKPGGHGGSGGYGNSDGGNGSGGPGGQGDIGSSKDYEGKYRKPQKYKTDTNCVRRVVLSSKEILNIDLSNRREIGDKTCSVYLELIDGEGRTTTDIELKEKYYGVVDNNNNNECTLKGNKIDNVSIKDKNIKLIFYLKDDYDHSMKFIYKVEV